MNNVEEIEKFWKAIKECLSKPSIKIRDDNKNKEQDSISLFTGCGYTEEEAEKVIRFAIDYNISVHHLFSALVGGKELSFSFSEERDD